MSRDASSHSSAFHATSMLCAACLALCLASPAAAAGDSARPNVLFIIIDDHSATLMDALRQSPVPTPNMRRLSERSTWFSRAYADVPLCGPSRTAILTGVHAYRSGVYSNVHAYRRASSWIARVKNLPQQFLEHGYLTAGYGKIAHNRFLEDDVSAFTPGCYKMLDHPEDVTHTDAGLKEFIIPGTLTQSWTDGWWPWGMLPDEWDRDDPSKLQQDTEFANHTIDLLGRRHDQPFLVICGFFRPHTSWTAPRRYFDRFPLDEIEIPPGFRGDDLEDVPAPGRKLATHRGEHDFIVRHALWKKHLQGFYAAISYVDEQIGRVLDSLEHGPNAENTIIVFAADNGFHIGEKNHWSKTTPWEQACRVAFAISVPGEDARVCQTPVGLIDIYPTLLTLCGLPRPDTHDLDGFDLAPIVRGTTTYRGAPAVSTIMRGLHSIRDDRFRYIRYPAGEEELYDHDQDPWEWTNLAGDPRYAAVAARLGAHVPVVDAPAIERVAKR